jgi:hypothetical protein
MTDSSKAGLREEVAKAIWIGGGGFEESWPRVRARRVEIETYADEKAAEAWAIADAILERFQVTPKLSRARASGVPVEVVGGGDVG